MNVLVACEFSGIVRNAFRALGHNAWSCDIIESLDHSPYHIQGDVLEYLNLGWDLMIAHPPCTFITNAGVRHLHISNTSRNGVRTEIYGPRRWDEMYKACKFFNALQDAPIPRICVENPPPHRYARVKIGRYSQLIRPWMFSHGEIKATCFWLKGLNKLAPTMIVDGRIPAVSQESPGVKNGLTRAQRRSITYQGIADALAEQYGGWVGY